MIETLDRPKSALPDLLLALGGLLGLAAFVVFYRDSVPQAAVTLHVTREEASATAREFLEERDAPVGSLKRAVQFGGSSIGLVFLQRTVGLDEASRWAEEEVPIWAWSLRWFQPQEKEEWRMGVGVDGTVVRFAHLIEEAAQGANLEREDAQAIAESFLEARGWKLADLELVEASSEKQDNRTDHSFTWEKLGSDIMWREGGEDSGNGSVRVSVDVHGDEVGRYRHFLRVPEDFERELSRTLGVGSALAIGSFALTFVLILIALGIAIARQRHGDIQWRFAFILAGLVAVLFVVRGFTSWPGVKLGYPTELQWVVYVGILALGLLIAATAYGVIVLFTAAAGESLGRQTFPASLVGLAEAVQGRLRSPHVVSGSLRGYALGFLILGYLTVFYLIARRYFGAWLPAEGPYSGIFNYYLPFITPLTLSLVAVISEEVTYRLFGISLFKRYFKSTLVALLLPAMIWAFAHSGYPVFPVYIRGIELTIAGLMFGLAFLYLGLFACIVAHFVIDAVLLGMPLLTSGNTTYLISGVAVMGFALLPAAMALVARQRTAAAAVTR